MSEPAYKKKTFICVKCNKKYELTLTAKSEIVHIEVIDKEEMSFPMKLITFSCYASMIGLIIHGFQTVKLTDRYFIPFVIAAAAMTFLMIIPGFVTIKGWISKGKEVK